MKRFLASLSTISLIEVIGRHPAMAAGMLSLLGVGGGAVISGMLTPPTLLPQISSNFNPNQFGTTNNGLKPNGGSGTDTSMAPPIGPSGGATGSFGLYFEAQVDPALGYGNGAAYAPFAGMLLSSNSSSGQPAFIFQRLTGGQTGTQWWETPHVAGNQNVNAAAGSNYATGLYPFPATGGGCAREPAGVWLGSSAAVEIVDPGFGCSTAPTFNAATIPNAGAAQTGITATCTSGGLGMLVMTSVPVSPGLSPGLTYSLSGFTTTPTANVINTTFTATSVTGSGPYTVVGTAAGTCPTGISTGTFGSGTGAAFNFPTISTTNPFSLGGTGITTKNGQKICGIIGEYGDDSLFPGAQFLEMVDDKGNPLPGSPAFVQTPNMGTTNFTGFTIINTQSPSSPAMTVLSMNPYPISTSPAPSYSGGQITFTTPVTTGNTAFVPGSQFTVSGLSSTSGNVNITYVVTSISGSGPYTIVGNPLSGPGGIPQALANPGAISGSGSLVSVIFPGMQVLGSTPAASFILPYGTFGGTGTGGAGTYGLSANQTSTLGGGGSPGSTIFAWSASYYTAAATATPAGGTATVRAQNAIGDFTGLIGSSAATVNGSLKTGWGGALGNFATLYGIIPTQTGGAPSTADLAAICTKATDIQAYAKAKSLKVESRYALSDLGIWGDSGNATITGYITNSSGTNATLNVVSMPYGSLTLPTGSANETANLTGVGLPVANPVTIPLTTTTTSSTAFAITPNTTTALGSSGSPVTFAVGAFKPALPIQSNTLRGYIDTTAGVSTLHVTSLDDGTTHSGFASFTGTLGTSFTASIAPCTGSNGCTTGGLLAVTLPTGTPPNNAYIGIGTLVSPAVGTSTFAATHVTGYAASPATPGVGYQGSYVGRRLADRCLASYVRERPTAGARNHIAGDRHHRLTPGRHGCQRRRRKPHGVAAAHHRWQRCCLDRCGQLLRADQRRCDDRVANDARSGRIYPELDRRPSNHKPGQDRLLQIGRDRPHWKLCALRQSKRIGICWLVRIARDLLRNDDHRRRRYCAGTGPDHS